MLATNQKPQIAFQINQMHTLRFKEIKPYPIASSSAYIRVWLDIKGYMYVACFYIWSF